MPKIDLPLAIAYGLALVVCGALVWTGKMPADMLLVPVVSALLPGMLKAANK